MAQNKRCMVPDELRGVRMSHSDDVVEVWHGLAEPPYGRRLACYPRMVRLMIDNHNRLEVSAMNSTRGYEVNMRQDRRTGEHLAVIPSAYDQGRGRYYMAYTLTDGWVELTPEYVTRHTATTQDYPESLKRAVDRNLGYILHSVPRLRSA